MDAPFDRGRARPGLDVSPERWADVSRVFSAAADLHPTEREAYLIDACSDDPTLRAAVESLLAAHDSAGSFGEGPLIAPARRLLPGSVLGPFRIESLVGAGGMGEVYRAYDTKLRRTVALKVLPDTFAADPDRRVRFEEEAHALAALNHPNVGAIHGLEDSGEVVALVLELVEGETLAERLAAGPIPFDEVVRIAQQLAEGLEAAHERGIVHRDFKPSNIKITPDGTVKILDFGLAKAAGTAERMTRIDSPFDSPPPSRDATAAGMIVGTAAYMSPEQARGGRIDKRTDIWAFGCVLFEMCALRPAFAGSSVAEILSAVIEREPDWTSLRPGTPSSLNRVLRRCLIKNPKLRLRDIGEARIALETWDAPGAPPAQKRSTGNRFLITGLVLAGLLGAILGYQSRRLPAPPSVALEVGPPGGTSFKVHQAQVFFALSPSGSQLAFIAAPRAGEDRRLRIWIRDLQAVELKQLPGTEGATSLFWSPGSDWLAFVADGKLKRVEVVTRVVHKICELPPAVAWHGTWGTGNTILLANGASTEILAVPAGGGSLRPVMTRARDNHEVRVHWPWFHPDGQRFLYTARRSDEKDGELRLGTLDGESRRIMRVRSNAQWVEPDLVVFVDGATLMGQRVDLDTARPIGDSFQLAEGVDYFPSTSRAMFSTSLTGTIAYHRRGELRQHVWVDRFGNAVEKVGTPGDFEPEHAGRLSPDGRSLLTALRLPRSSGYDIWRYDLIRGGPGEPLTEEWGNELAPVPTDGGQGMAYAADINGSLPTLLHKNLVTKRNTQLLASDNQQIPQDAFPDGAIGYAHVLPGEGFQVFRLPRTPPGSPVRLLRSVRSAWNLRLSPDGLTMAYIETGQGERSMNVAPTDESAPPEPIAQGIRGLPRWSRDGKAIYFIGRDDALVRVPVQVKPRLVVGEAQSLFTVKPGTVLIDIAHDGRLLLLEPQVLAGDLPIVVSTSAIPSRTR